MAGKDSQKGWDSGAVWMKEKIIARGVCVWGGERVVWPRKEKGLIKEVCGLYG